ncbi:MAG: MoaD/ThiS family protein [Pyrinomonadaceae bacterium]|jgi:molybdopterin converting factor small subunit|nr:MoaD/ThiS family protein [Pyrinomonadaceae bacterium]
MKVLFFGQTAEIVGTRELEISLDIETKASEVFAKILETYPKLKENKLLFSVNQEYSNGNEILTNDDELAIFTAVSGG